MAEPRCELYANLARTIAIPLSLIAVHQGWPIYSIAIMGFIGEICALITAYTLLKVPFSRRSLVASMRTPLLLLVIFIGTAFFYSQLSIGIDGLVTRLAAAVFLAFIFIILCLVVYRSVPNIHSIINDFNRTPQII
jgi:hypothetical protein